MKKPKIKLMTCLHCGKESPAREFLSYKTPCLACRRKKDAAYRNRVGTEVRKAQQREAWNVYRAKKKAGMDALLKK
jgi:hypothetical protein